MARGWGPQTSEPPRATPVQTGGTIEDLHERYLRWRERHRHGWGLAWTLATALTSRFGARCGLQAMPLHHEGVGWYGLRLDLVPSEGESCTLGRITAAGDVEDWRSGTHERFSLTESPGVDADPAALVAAAIACLRLSDLPATGFGAAEAADAAIAIDVLARVALRWPTGEFALLPPRESRHGAGLSPRIVLHHDGGSFLVGTRAAHDAVDLCIVAEVMAGAPPWAVAARIANGLGLYPPPFGADHGGYGLVEHRHRYAAWCAARAAGRGLAGATTEVLRRALEASDLPALLAGPPEHWPTIEPDYRERHVRWCGQILQALGNQGVEGATFGRAAKLVAIYVKTLIVCGGQHHTPLARVAHPPIDRILLQALAGEKRFSPELREMWRQTAWTSLNVDGYQEIALSLQEVVQPAHGFWRVERWWGAAGE